tara:strand:+ start:76 stop:246 length:171 start_codon:yes stop_codon:yes gene_type:complete
MATLMAFMGTCTVAKDQKEDSPPLMFSLGDMLKARGIVVSKPEEPKNKEKSEPADK